MTTEVEYYWDTLTDLGIATSEEIGLACALCGCNIHTLEMILCIRTGYCTLEQLLEDLEEEDME